MKPKFLLSILVLGIFAFSCKEGGLNPTNCRDGKCTYSFEEGKKLVLDTVATDVFFALVQDGPDLVFSYQYAANESPRIADDEYTEYIRFQVPAGVDSFRYKDDELENMPMYLSPICFCPQEVSMPISGEISGEKTKEGVWEVELDVVFNIFGSMEERSFSSRFERSE